MVGCHSIVRYWIPVLLWMALIFSASTDALSSGNTSRIIGPIVRWLFPSIDDATLWTIVAVLRKSAHVVEYAILSLLVWRALRKPVRGDVRPWKWSHALWALAWAVLYSFSDEFHQGFVPSREGSIRDVGFDTAGAVLGLLTVWCWGKFRKRW